MATPETERSLQATARKIPLFPRLNWAEVAVRGAIRLHQLQVEAVILEKKDPDNKTIFHGFERKFLDDISSMITERMGWEVTHNEEGFPEHIDGDRYIYLANHPTLTAVWVWADFMTKHFAKNNFAIGKDNIIKNPISRFLLGDLMVRANKGLFIDRSKRKDALNKIRLQTAELLQPDTAGSILVDAHRPYNSTIKKNHRYYSEKYPEIDVPNSFPETCFPLSGGVWSMGEATEGMDRLRFLNATVVEPKPTHTFGGRLHIDVKEISREELFGEEPNVEHLRTKLIELWKIKNKLIQSERR